MDSAFLTGKEKETKTLRTEKRLDSWVKRCRIQVVAASLPVAPPLLMGAIGVIQHFPHLFCRTMNGFL
jgi:hypothetical protein